MVLTRARDRLSSWSSTYFTTYCFCTRDVGSAIGREGLGDSYELQIRYMLAKFVFVSLKYKGWVGLSEHALHEKAEPYKFAVREHWKRLKRSDTELGCSYIVWCERPFASYLLTL